MTIRQAQNTESDMLFVFCLSNDPSVRASSFNSELILIEDHKKWYSSTVVNDNILFFLFFDDSDFIGQIRFFRKSASAAITEISVSIMPSFRGKGVGEKMLNLAISELRARWSWIRTILAEVKKGNAASNRFFKKTGFLEDGVTMHGQSLCNRYKLEIEV